MDDDKIIGNVLIPVSKKDFISYNDFLRRIKQFEISLTYDKFLEIQEEFNFKARAEKEKLKREKKEVETNESLQDLFKELKIKKK